MNININNPDAMAEMMLNLNANGITKESVKALKKTEGFKKAIGSPKSKNTKSILGDEISRIVNDGAFFQLLRNLKDRWDSEKEYEDFAEYQKAMKKAFPASKSSKFIKSTKRPFGIKCVIDNTKVDIHLKFKGNGVQLASRPSK